MTLSPVAEDYLKTIYHLQEEHSRRVRTVEIADAMEVTPPSVSSMLDTLEKLALVEYTPYKGVELTPAGEQRVLNLVRKHRLLETFLSEHLEYPWPAVHEEADELEHHVSDELARRLSDLLGDPATDPHGEPIPDEELAMTDARTSPSLSECGVGDTVVVEQVPHRDSDIGNFLFERSIEPGERLVVTDVTAVDIMTVVPQSSESAVSIPNHTARRISVRDEAVEATANN